MADDIKSLTKKNSDLEKRLKLAEAKIKVLADSMTDPKRIEKFMATVTKGQTDIEKRLKREGELRQQAQTASQKAWDKKFAVQDAERKKEKAWKDRTYDLESRIMTLESAVSRLEAGNKRR